MNKTEYEFEQDRLNLFLKLVKARKERDYWLKKYAEISKTSLTKCLLMEKKEVTKWNH